MKLSFRADSLLRDIREKYVSEMASMSALQETSQKLSMQVVAGDERAARAEAELVIEHEWRSDLQKKEVTSTEQINTLQLQIKQLKEEGKKHERVKQDMEKVKRQWSEAQTTLEELGIQLSVSKLQVSELQEKVHAKDTLALSGVGANSDPGGGGVWTPDNITSKCKGCNREFSFTRRKHHCRNCGGIFCNSCSEQQVPLPNDHGQIGKPVRVCDGCWDIINAPRN